MFSSASASSSRPAYCSIVSIGAKNHILHSYYSSEERENEIKTQTLTKSHVLDGWSEIEMEWAIANLIIYLAAAARRRTSNCNQGIHTKMLLFKSNNGQSDGCSKAQCLVSVTPSSSLVLSPSFVTLLLLVCQISLHFIWIAIKCNEYAKIYLDSMAHRTTSSTS